MIEKYQLKRGIYEPSSDISLNWREMRSEFGYKLLGEIALHLRRSYEIKKDLN